MWIESHQSLRQHPKTLKAARALGCSRVTLIGHLHCLWWWALDYAQDGVLTPFSALDIASAAEWTGDPETFLWALIEESKVGEKPGFLEYAGSALLIHDWFEYAGKLIEKRHADAERKRVARQADRQEDIPAPSMGNPADGAGTDQPTKPKPPSKQPADKNVAIKYPSQVAVFLRAGGKLPTGRLGTGQSKSDRASAWICDRVADTPDSLELWSRVVAGYCAQWSNTSYQVMVTEYYQVGRVPGERKNGNGKAANNREFGLQGTTGLRDRTYQEKQTDARIAAAQAEFNAAT